MRLRHFIVLVLLISSFSLLVYQNSYLGRMLAEEREKRVLLEESYSLLLQKYENASLEAEALRREGARILSEYERLMEERALLNKSFASLQRKYEALLSAYVNLEASYAMLNGSYAALLKEYNALAGSLGDREALLKAFYKPLWSNETATPSVNELKEWLKKDETSEIKYTAWDFVCGDYAVMLALHAKLMGWDMGIVAVVGKREDGKEFNHVFNAIRCKEGLVFIEPQNDEVFYGPISAGKWYTHPGYGKVYVEEFILIVPYQPPF